MVSSAPYGRDDVLRRVLAELETPGVLVTLTGLPGAGTSAVARAALRLAGTDGPAVDAHDGTPLTTCTVEGRANRSVAALEAALERCASADVGLVLVEDVHHAEDGPAVVERLRRSRPGLRVLLTARTPVGLADEVVVRVPPLPLPDPLDDPRRLRAEPAVRLFLDRAARAGAAVDDGGPALADVARICRHVGGLPLAVELVAARAVTYSPGTLLRLLHRSPGQLLRPPGGTGTTRGAQGTDHDLGAALAWSLSLLDGSTRDLLRDLTVLGSPGTVDDVEQVAGRDDVVDDLAALVDVHLVEADHEEPLSRFRVAPVVRDQLRALAPPCNEVRERHRSWASQVARRCLELDDAGRLTAARRRAAVAEPDLSEALDAAEAAGDITTATDLALALLPVWFSRGVTPGTVERLAGLLPRIGTTDGTTGDTEGTTKGTADGTSDGGQSAPAPSSRTLLLAAWVQLLRAETAGASEEVAAVVPGLTRIISAARERDERTLLGVLFVAVQAARSMVDREAAQAWAEEGHALATRHGDEARLVRLETWLGMLAHQRGDTDEAAGWARQALARARRLDDPALALSPTGMLLSLPVPPPADLELPDQRRLVDLARQHGDLRTLDWLEPMAAFGALHAGDLPTAVHHSLATLRRAGATGARPRAGPPLLALFLTALQLQDLRAAGRLLGMVGRHIEVLRPSLPPALAAVFDQAEATYHAATGAEGDREVAWSSHLSHDEMLAAAAALGRDLDRAARERQTVDPAPDEGSEVPPTDATAEPPDVGPSVIPHEDRRTEGELTAREREVLEVLSSGATNREISALLGISPKTVMHHTSSIYRKLAVRGRAEAVAHHLRRPGTGPRPQTERAISRSR